MSSHRYMRLDHPGLEPGANGLKVHCSTIELVILTFFFLVVYNHESYFLTLHIQADEIFPLMDVLPDCVLRI